MKNALPILLLVLGLALVPAVPAEAQYFDCAWCASSGAAPATSCISDCSGYVRFYTCQTWMDGGCNGAESRAATPETLDQFLGALEETDPNTAPDLDAEPVPIH